MDRHPRGLAIKKNQRKKKRFITNIFFALILFLVSFTILYYFGEEPLTQIIELNEHFSLKNFKIFKHKISNDINSKINYHSIIQLLEKNDLSLIEKRILQMNILKNYYTKIDKISLISHIHNSKINEFLKKNTEHILKIKQQGSLYLEILIIQKNDKFDSKTIAPIDDDSLNKLIIENTLIQVNVFDTISKNKIDEEIQ